MKFFSSTALALACLAASAADAQYSSTSTSSIVPPQESRPAPVAETGKQAPAITLSAKAKPAIAALQQAIQANDRAKIPAALAAAQAAAQTKEDRWYIGELQLKAAVAANDPAAMATAVDAIVASGQLDQAKASEMYKSVGAEQYNAKQYAAAAASFQKAAAANPGDPEVTYLIGRTMVVQGQNAAAVPILKRAIQTYSATGAKAPEDMYRFAVQAAFNAKSPELSDVARQWVIAYPGPDSWRNTLAIVRASDGIDDSGGLAAFRLMNATRSLKNAADYRNYVKGLLDNLNFNEAQAVVDQGLAANAIDLSDPQNSALVAAARAKPKATAEDLAAAAKSAQSGMALLKIGDRFYGLGDYAKAADLYRQARARGVDSATVNLRVGTALARAGDKAGAASALNAVDGPDGEIAKLWLLYLQQR